MLIVNDITCGVLPLVAAELGCLVDVVNEDLKLSQAELLVQVQRAPGCNLDTIWMQSECRGLFAVALALLISSRVTRSCSAGHVT